MPVTTLKKFSVLNHTMNPATPSASEKAAHSQNMKHTDAPFKLIHTKPSHKNTKDTWSCIECSGDKSVSFDIITPQCVPKNEAALLAARIVLCVNTHDRLVEVIKELTDAIGVGYNVPKYLRPAWDNAHQALKDATAQ